jgi:hypothetical protein
VPIIKPMLCGRKGYFHSSINLRKMQLAVNPGNPRRVRSFQANAI